MVRSAEYQKPPTGTPTVLDDLGQALMFTLEAAVLGLVHVLWWALLFPMISLPVAAVVALWWWLGWPYAVGVAALSVAGWALWWAWWPNSWRRWVWGRMRSRYLTWKRYRRGWKTLTALHKLTTILDTGVLTPRLATVTIGDTADELLIKLLKGQTAEQWAKQADALRHSFGALRVRVRLAEPGWVRVQVIHTDRLLEPVAFPRVEPKTVDLEALTIGLTEMGTPWRVRLLGNQILVAGETGSGKGSVVWSLIAALGPAIREGWVVLWMIDPKGGMEYGAARKWLARFASDNGPGAVAILRDAVELVQKRGNTYMDKWERKITPTVDEPLVVVLIDEAASLTAYYNDRKIKDEISRLLGVVLTQSRAVAAPVVACLQDPSKDIVEMRQLFPCRLGLRMAEPTQPNMLFGPSGRDRGALCDEIPETTPGVAYVQEEGSTDITRVRAYHVTDDDIRWIMATYPLLPRDTEGKPIVDMTKPAETDEDHGGAA
ncbi:FtsK/SpoIIIE domain-containing protein [Nocardia vinacea]|uniref:FtsK/SpoIIIE domain-containing protein n=1 Tax=Nocardia vinacea TaxID=96468 RepID=UPI002E10007A|nr:FtsK/SpoIIIE domain-containing protein [Nocardia vinacea]